MDFTIFLAHCALLPMSSFRWHTCKLKNNMLEETCKNLGWMVVERLDIRLKVIAWNLTSQPCQRQMA